MDARIDDETNGTPHLVAQTAEILVWRFVNAHLDTEFFGVEAPPLAECVWVKRAPELRDALEFLRDLLHLCGLVLV